MADWKRRDEFGNPIIDMDGHIFSVLTEEEQKIQKIDYIYGLKNMMNNGI